ncbi:hypothetical protein CAPTEDRAFT_142357 [Capitella teleta]|uniref:Zinc transporter 2 n=1 Tax=Capitella teleta TaxID=283909 RepID=R7T475_CAPTE|nr:hypothetical protein CAPTEDRAFT_142357 [Capitella teleta]|eukprot:ELT87571.1 hypothetical protein CAPTEDRAFT_142357 [Capitella teleta]
MHCHTDKQEDRLDRRARNKLIIASMLCVLFMIAEAVGGVLANSLAVATDAAHLLTDFASFMISLFSLYVASRPSTKKMSFGYYRAEVIGALVSVLLIWVVTAVLVYLAVDRVISGDYEIGGATMLITAGCAVAFNIFMGLTLHDTHGHSHGGGSHGHSHGENHTQHQPNINVRAAFIHVIGDFLQSLGVMIAAIVVYFKPEYKIVDPICTFLFSILVLFTTITILRDTLNVLMEGTPKGIDFQDVRQALCTIPGVRELHNLRIWSLTVSKVALSVHLAVEPSTSHQQTLAIAARLMRERFGVHECTVQIEDYVDEMDDCTQCQEPKD